MSTTVIRVVLADDHPVVRTGVAALLDHDPHIEVVGEASNGEEAVALVKQLNPDALVIDVRLGSMDGVEVCAHLRATRPDVAVIMLTQFAHESVMLRAFEAGARGFVIKGSDAEHVVDAIGAVMEGNVYVDPSVGSRLINLAVDGRRAKGPYDLTLMEMRVLEMLPKGLTNAEIAKELAVSTETVKTHLRHAMRKLGVNDRAEAAAVAVREGLA